MDKIRFFLLKVLFFGIPLIYAWFYIPLFQTTLADFMDVLVPNIRWSGFESVKVLFLLLISLFLLSIELFSILVRFKPISRYVLIASLVFFIWSVSSFTLNYDINPDFLFGNPEKTHGFFFYIALFIIFWSVFFLHKNQKKILFHITYFAFFGVALYGIFQRIGLDPLSQLYSSRLDPGRIFSTLGNPNYLAGYVLMLLPLLRSSDFSRDFLGSNSAWQLLVWLLSGFLVYSSGSYLAWIIFVAYGSYVIVQHTFIPKKHRQIFWISSGTILILFIMWIWMNYSSEILAAQKMKGFIARWYLWKTGISAIFYDIPHFLFGFGPDGFLSVSEHFRHPLLSVYEDPAYRIDRSHNVFIDFALHFGMPLTVLGLWLVFSRLSRYSIDKKESLFLFALYFSFNIPVLVHFLIVILILTSGNDDGKIIHR